MTVDHGEKWRGTTLAQRLADCPADVVDAVNDIAAHVNIEVGSREYVRVLETLADFAANRPQRCPTCSGQLYCAECEVVTP